MSVIIFELSVEIDFEVMTTLMIMVAGVAVLVMLLL